MERKEQIRLEEKINKEDIQKKGILYKKNCIKIFSYPNVP